MTPWSLFLGPRPPLDMFRRSEPLDADVKDALQELSRLAAERPYLKSHAAVLNDLLPIVFTRVGELSCQLAGSQAREKLGAGVPILRGESMGFQSAGFEQRLRAISRVLDRHAGRPHRSSLARLVGRAGGSSQEMVDEVLSGDMCQLSGRAAEAGLGEESLKTALRLSLFPLLSGFRRGQQQLLQRCGWQGGHCPVCGSFPLLAELRGLEQTRHLRCGLCAGDWEFPRLQCPFCGNRDHHQLGYFHVQQEGDKFRAATCDVCRGYIKTAATLGTLSDPRLLVMDVATLHLDLAAVDRGFAVP